MGKVSLCYMPMNTGRYLTDVTAPPISGASVYPQQLGVLNLVSSLLQSRVLCDALITEQLELRSRSSTSRREGHR